MSSLESLIASGTRLWLDSIDLELVVANRKLGATGATSNPIIVADLIKTGRFDARIEALAAEGFDDHEITWRLTDELVSEAEKVFWPVWHETKGDDGYVSFEIDPLLEDLELGPPHKDRVRAYIELGKKWAQGHKNRMIKVPATPAGLDALEELAAAGINLNVTLIFSSRQYQVAREAVWRGAQRRGNLANFKSVYSIFVSRLDVYAEKKYPGLSPMAQGLVGIVNAKRIWQENCAFWQKHATPLKQEIVFASTGTKKPEDAPWKYVEAFAGSDIETNPPSTNDAVSRSGKAFQRHIDRLPERQILEEIDRSVNWEQLEHDLMAEGLKKFAEPQKELLRLISEKRKKVTNKTS